MARARALIVLALSLAAVARVCAAGPERTIYEYVDESGKLCYTSDASAASEAPPFAGVPSDDESLVQEESDSVAESLSRYFETYSKRRGKSAVTSLKVDVTAPEVPDRGRLRAAAERVELLASIDRQPGQPDDPQTRQELVRLLFPPLRSIYPAAYLTVTVHDGVHTVARADWDPAQPEPAYRVR